jgi:hypothetical protein
MMKFGNYQNYHLDKLNSILIDYLDRYTYQ